MGLLRKTCNQINFIRTNRIQDDDVNHGGWFTIFLTKKVKRLKINKIKKLFFQLIFSTYLPKVLLKFQVEVLIGCKFNSSVCILSMDPATRKIRNTWKNVIAVMFFMYFSFKVHQKYRTWVLLGWGIKLCIQWVFPLQVWVNPYP